MTFKSEFLTILQERGYIHQCTNFSALDELLIHERVTAYIGFDCTAECLHVGSLLQLMLLRIFQRCGHRPIILIGGGTSKIGDPSGKDQARTILSKEQIAFNSTGIIKVVKKFLCFKKEQALLVDNATWLDDLNYITFLRDIGRHFSINQMLNYDSVKLRLQREQHLSFLEFNYMLLQAYDFVELHKRYNCRVQFGGSDQWGNIISGIELSKKFLAIELFGVTTPLLCTDTGQKMGKTAQGAIWLNETMCSSYNYWQYFRNLPDTMIEQALYLFTDLSVQEITRLCALQGEELNYAKEVLANEVTAICHSKEKAEQASKTAQAAFKSNDLTSLPTLIVDKNTTLLSVIQASKLVDSNSQAKELLRSGAIKINNVKVSLQYSLNDLKQTFKLSIGKKHHFKVLLQ